MNNMLILLTSNIELTGLLLGTISGILELVSIIGLICIVVDETNKFKYKQRRKKEEEEIFKHNKDT